MRIPGWLVHFLLPGPLHEDIKRLILLYSGHVRVGQTSLCYFLY